MRGQLHVDQGFFYETVAPLLLVGVTSLICISTLTSDINFYTRLFKIKDPITGLPVFAQLQVALVCNACREAGQAASCRHMLHLVPAWQSSARHERLKAVMSDRPDLIQSELAGLAFDALQQCFRAVDIDALMVSDPPPFVWAQKLYMIIDPAAGGPQSDFALITFYRQKGIIVVSAAAFAISCGCIRPLDCARNHRGAWSHSPRTEAPSRPLGFVGSGWPCRGKSAAIRRRFWGRGTNI